MSHLNVIPSAPPEIYPNLANVQNEQTQTPISVSPHDFRLTKVNEIAATLAHEVNHYRFVAKKYKRAKTITSWFAGGSGIISAVASSASLGTALSIIGLPAAIPLGAVILRSQVVG